METWGLSDPNLQSQIAVKLFRLSYVAESHIMMTGKKHENEVGRGNHLSSFLKITIFLGKKNVIISRKYKFKWSSSVSHQNETFSKQCYWFISLNNVLYSGIWEFVLCLCCFSNSSFFSGKIRIKMQTEEPSSYLTQNIISPNTYIKSIMEKARPGSDRLQWPGVNQWPSLFHILQNGEIYCERNFSRQWGNKKKKINQTRGYIHKV